MWFIGDEVEQETNAPPPKKNPGSAPAEPQPHPFPLDSEMVDSSVTLYVNWSGLINSHAGSSDLSLMFGCMTSNFMLLLSLFSLVTAKISSLNQQGFQIAQLVTCLSFYSYLFFAFSGNSLFCWISDSTAKAVAVVTPVCLALVFNAVCLTKSLYAIHRLKKVCHSQSTGNIIKNIFQLSCNLS